MKWSGEEAKRDEGRDLARVEGREHAANGEALQTGDEARAEKRGHDLHGKEEAGGGDRADGRVVDEHGEGDLPEPVAELVDRVGGARLAKPGTLNGRASSVGLAS